MKFKFHELMPVTRVLIPLVLLLTGCAEHGRLATPSEVVGGAVLLGMAATMNGRITVSGEVVDEQGRRLDQVTVEIEKSRLENFGERSVYSTRSVVIDGSFRIRESNCASLRLWFRKNGYYSQQVSVTRESASKIGSLRVALEKAGNVTRLLPYGGMLEYAAGGAGRILNFEKSHVGKKALQTVLNVHTPSALPPNCGYVIPEQGGDGRIAVVRVPRSYGQNNVDTFPQRIRLILQDPNGGFIPFSPAVRKNIYHQMKQAPEAGYQRELVLTPDCFAQAQAALIQSKDNDLHFFFKTGGKYGKGSIGQVYVDRSGTNVTLGVAFRLQPDGSRNVETDEGPGENFMPATMQQ